MEPVEKVAVLALIYRTAYRDRHSGSVCLFDDLESCPGEVSLMSMAASHMLTPEDWALVTLMDELYSPCAEAHQLDSFSPLRSEAILHAWPNDPRDELAKAGWAAAYLARWPDVEAEMDALSPATWSHETMEEVASAAVDALDG